MNNGLQKTSLGDFINVPRQDLVKGDFTTLLFRRGRRVLWEQALMCPCKSKATNQLSTCKNCGGSGYLFINPVETRMVLQGFDAKTTFAPWSEEVTGVVKVTCNASFHLTYMDRITVLDGEGIHNEVLNIKDVVIDAATVRFSYTAYQKKRILYVGLYTAADAPLLRLIEGTDYTWEGNVFKLLKSVESDDVTITVRYVHNPIVFILDMNRETMQSYALKEGVEMNQNLPIMGYAKKGHYKLGDQNLTGDAMLDNSYTITCD